MVPLSTPQKAHFGLLFRVNDQTPFAATMVQPSFSRVVSDWAMGVIVVGILWGGIRGGCCASAGTDKAHSVAIRKAAFIVRSSLTVSGRRTMVVPTSPGLAWRLNWPDANQRQPITRPAGC